MKNNEGTSAALFRRSLAVTPGGVHSPVRAFKSVGGDPIFFEKAQGAYLTSVDGNRYIDFCQSFGPLILGHRDPDVEKVVKATAETAWTFGTCEPYSLELAELITSKIPWVEKIRFVSSGTEAVMSALRVARAATGRNKILKFEGCYHGHSDSLLVKAGSGLAGLSVTDSAGVSLAQAQETLTAPLDAIEKVKEIFSSHGREIAAVILEPLPANYGLLIQTEAFWHAVFREARNAGSLIIFDEVISGFRVGFDGMAGALKFQPDLVTYGKILGGGFPVGAYGGKQSLMDLVAPLGPAYQAGTLSANPFGMRAGLATLKKLVDGKVYETLNQRTSKFCNDFNQWAHQKGYPLEFVFQGSIFWLVEKTRDPIRSVSAIPEGHKGTYAKIFHKMIERGIYMAPSGFEVAFMSLAHDDEVCKIALNAVKQAVEDVFA